MPLFSSNNTTIVIRYLNNGIFQNYSMINSSKNIPYNQILHATNTFGRNKIVLTVLVASVQMFVNCKYL